MLLSEFNNLLRNRRSIRNYQDRDVPLDLVQQIIRDATLAPSAGHAQPWQFVIVRDRALMNKLSWESKQNLLALIEADPDHYVRKYENYLNDESYNVYYNAPCLVFIGGNKDYQNLLIDCSLAACYFMMSAAARGLGTCWIGLGSAIRTHELREALGMDATYQIVAPIILGYPVEIPDIPERNEPAILNIIETERQEL
jgi:nitroreductase